MSAPDFKSKVVGIFLIPGDSVSTGGIVIARLVCDSDQLSGDFAFPSQWPASEVQRKVCSLENRFSRVFSGDVFVEVILAPGLQVGPGNNKAMCLRPVLRAKAQRRGRSGLERGRARVLHEQGQLASPTAASAPAPPAVGHPAGWHPSNPNKPCRGYWPCCQMRDMKARWSPPLPGTSTAPSALKMLRAF